jgi:hypothetical protein
MSLGFTQLPAQQIPGDPSLRVMRLKRGNERSSLYEEEQETIPLIEHADVAITL